MVERSEVVAFTMGQEAGSVSEPRRTRALCDTVFTHGRLYRSAELALQLDALEQAAAATVDFSSRLTTAP